MTDIRPEVLQGIASLLWQSAWMSHAIAHDCVNVSGKHIADVMPIAPREVYAAAEELLCAVEVENGQTIGDLFADATRACNSGGSCSLGLHTPCRFGECIAYAYLGDGVTWSDDHDALGEPIVTSDTGELQDNLEQLAADRCKHNSRSMRMRHACGSYKMPRKTCTHCGE